MKNPGTQTTKRSKFPIKDRPLPQPGDSLAEANESILIDKIVPWFILSAVFCALAVYDWFYWAYDLPRSPTVSSLAAILVIIISCIYTIRYRKQMKFNYRGLLGERSVGQFLDNILKPYGYFIFHDIVIKQDDGTCFNIDHVIVGPGGIYAIDTKTWSKPEEGDAKIHYDGKAVRIIGGPSDEKPVNQAISNANTIRRILKEMTGRTSVNVFPVVLFPDWYITGNPPGSPVWVLAPRAFPKWLNNAGEVLSKEDVALYQSRLAMHIRNNQQVK